jgi:hypothetical protein
MMRTQPLNEWDKKWMQYRDTNPDIYALLKQFASKLVSTGKRFGVGLLIERVRWEKFFATPMGEEYKFNDGYAAYLSRDLAEDVPGYGELVRQKRLWYGVEG